MALSGELKSKTQDMALAFQGKLESLIEQELDLWEDIVPNPMHRYAVLSAVLNMSERQIHAAVQTVAAHQAVQKILGGVGDGRVVNSVQDLVNELRKEFGDE